MTSTLWQKVKRIKVPLDESERGEWKSWLKIEHSKMKVMASGPITSWQIEGETMERVIDFIFLGSKITADGYCSHGIKRHLFLGRKIMTKLNSILKSRDITLPTKVHVVKAMVFLVVMYGCDSWTVKTAECRRIDVFELWCWRRLLKVPWTARRPNQSILKEISTEYSLERLMLKLKLQYFGHQKRKTDSLEKTLRLGKIEGRMRSWQLKTEDEMLGWHNQLSEHEFEQVPGIDDRQGSLVCCSPCGLSQIWLNDWNDWLTDWLMWT